MKLFSFFLVIEKETTSYRTEERPCVDFIESLDARTWDDAWDACKRKGGELAFFRTQEELQLFIKNHSTIKHRWLGIYRDGELWRNIRGEFQNILDWNFGEPNDSGGKEDCVMIYRNGKEHWNNKLNDEDCSNEWPYTCRIENCPPEEENSMLMDSGISDVFEYEEEEEEEQEELVFNEEILDIVDSLDEKNRETIRSFFSERNNFKSGYDSFGEQCFGAPELIFDRYKFFPSTDNWKDDLSFSEAKDHCEMAGDGWSLLVVNTDEEWNFIKTFVANSCWAKKPWWTGVKEYDTKGSRKSGRVVVEEGHGQDWELKWEGSEPNDKLALEECVLFKDNYFYDSDCTKNFFEKKSQGVGIGFVCENHSIGDCSEDSEGNLNGLICGERPIEFNEEMNDLLDNMRPAKREAIGSYLADRGNIKNGYDSFGEECSTPPELVYDRFKFFPSPENSKTFNEAQEHCESFGDDWGLMILNTGDEWNFISTFLANSCWAKKPWWIGVTEHETQGPKQPGTLQTIYGKEVEWDPRWEGEEPNDASGEEECIYFEDNYFYDGPCEQKIGYACEKHNFIETCHPKDEPVESPINYSVHMPDEINGNRDFESAQRYCKAKGEGWDLAVPNSEEEFDLLVKMTNCAPNRVWLGAFYAKDETEGISVFESAVDGSQGIFERWNEHSKFFMKNPINRSGGKECLRFRGNLMYTSICDRIGKIPGHDGWICEKK